jgi:hypothetical protein
MRSARRFGAFVSGLLLYSTVICVSGVLAEQQLPRELASLLGGHSSGLSIFVTASAIALLMFAMAVGWSYVTVRPKRHGRRPTTSWCVAGIMTAWLGWVVYGALELSVAPRASSMPVGSWLLSSDMPPLWGVLNTLAVVAGAVLAGSLARRFAPPKNSNRWARPA